MKVLRIVSELDFGGVEQVLSLSIPALAKVDGLEVKVVVLGRGGRIWDKLISAGYSVLVLNQKVRIPNLKLVWRLKQLLQAERPDVIHCQGAEANFHGIWAAKLAGVKTIIGEEIGLPNHHSYWSWIFKWIYRKADCVIAISEAVKNNIVQLGEVGGEKVRVIYNPVFLERIENREQGLENRKQRMERTERKEFVQWTNLVRACPEKRSVSGGQDAGGDIENRDKKFVFVTTCRLVPIKNLDRLIQAFAGLVKTNPEKELLLRIVGDGPERGNLELLIKNLKLESQVELLGFQFNVWPYLVEVDAFVLPSLREGSSVSLAEAMGMGLPSIVTEVGGASEILGTSNSGLMVDPLSVDSIRSAMQSMLDLTAEERAKMGQQAKEEAKRFSVENYIKDLMSIYTE